MTAHRSFTYDPLPEDVAAWLLEAYQMRPWTGGRRQYRSMKDATPYLEFLLALEEAGYTYTNVAKVVGVTRERVRQHVKFARNAGVEPKSPIPLPKAMSARERQAEKRKAAAALLPRKFKRDPIDPVLLDRMRTLRDGSRSMNGAVRSTDPRRRMREDLLALAWWLHTEGRWPVTEIQSQIDGIPYTSVSSGQAKRIRRRATSRNGSHSPWLAMGLRNHGYGGGPSPSMKGYKGHAQYEKEQS